MRWVFILFYSQVVYLLCNLNLIALDECLHNPCQNGGTCAGSSDTYTCTCTAGYEGDNCENGMEQLSNYVLSCQCFDQNTFMLQLVDKLVNWN